MLLPVPPVTNQMLKEQKDTINLSLSIVSLKTNQEKCPSLSLSASASASKRKSVHLNCECERVNIRQNDVLVTNRVCDTKEDQLYHEDLFEVRIVFPTDKYTISSSPLPSSASVKSISSSDCLPSAVSEFSHLAASSTLNSLSSQTVQCDLQNDHPNKFNLLVSDEMTVKEILDEPIHPALLISLGSPIKRREFSRKIRKPQKDVNIILNTTMELKVNSSNVVNAKSLLKERF